MIKFYRTTGEYGCFSNFSQTNVLLDGKKWSSSEHLYQAAKFPTSELYPGEEITICEKIRKCTSCLSAKNIGNDRSLPIIPNWDDIKYDVMKSVVRTKFSQHESFKQALLNTGNEELVEDSPSDYIWGCGADGTGKNWLGKILMEVREEFRGEPHTE